MSGPNSPLEILAVAIILAACLAFIVSRVLRVARGTRSSCCSGSSAKRRGSKVNDEG
jgi:hypothetical protein